MNQKKFSKNSQKKFENHALNPRFTIIYYSPLILPFFTYFYWLVLKKSSANSMSGLPWSDAAGWNSCILSLSKFGMLPTGGVDEFCLRRPIYPFILSPLRIISNNAEVTNLILVIIFVIASAFFLHSLNRLGTPFLGICIYLIAFFKWLDYGQGQFLTESVGLIFALMAANYMVRFTKSLELTDFLGFLFYLVVVDLIRPSDAFIKFLVALFFLLVAKGWRVKLKGLLGATCLILLLPNLLKVLAQAKGFDNFLNKGNSWSIIYGLVNGNQPYTYSDSIRKNYPNLSESEFWNVLKEDSLNKIWNDPMSLFGPVLDNFAPLIANLNSIIFTNYVSSITEKFNGIFVLLFITCIFIITSSLFINAINLNAKNFIFNKFNQQQFLAFLIFSSTLFSYLITYRNDVHRTNSTSVVYGFGALFLAISNYKYRTREYKHPRIIVQNLTSRFTSFSMIVQIIVLSTVISTVDIGKNDPKSLNMKCDQKGDIYLLPGTTSIKQTTNIELNPNFYWSTPLSRLPSGLLIQGLYLENSEIRYINIYVKQDSINLEKSCFRDSSSQSFQDLISLGYLEKSVVTF
jgi:hypothetical protein